MSNILFSVIVPSYNNARYLRELFDSLLSQSYENWEVIFVDDCSTDNSLALVRKFCEEDIRVRFFKHKENLGVGAAFKTAAEHAQGEIVGMLGADDALVPNAIEKMVVAHQDNPEASLINSDSFHCNEKLKILGRFEGFNAVPSGYSLIERLTVCNFATFKKSAYDKTPKFNENLRKAVDHDIFLKLDEQGELFYVHEKLYLYRVHSGGVSQGQDGMRAAQSSILAKRDAYYRRVGTTKSNLSYIKFRDMMITYYLRESSYYWGLDRSKCNFFLKKSLMEFVSIVFKRKYWTILIRNNVSFL